MIAVIVPTRGFLFTQVSEVLEVERAFHDMRVYYSYDLPIPDSFNYLVKEAIHNEGVIGRFDRFWFVEEDTVPPMGALSDLLSCDSDIAFIDYPVHGWSCSAKDIRGNVLWCGLGCTLVKREVFDAVEEPWFRSDKVLRLNDGTWQNNPAKYGGQDIWFSVQARNAGYTIKQVKGECVHLKLEHMGAEETNNGLHMIKPKPNITKLQIIKEVSDLGRLSSK